MPALIDDFDGLKGKRKQKTTLSPSFDRYFKALAWVSCQIRIVPIVIRSNLSMFPTMSVKKWAQRRMKCEFRLSSYIYWHYYSIKSQYPAFSEQYGRNQVGYIDCCGLVWGKPKSSRSLVQIKNKKIGKTSKLITFCFHGFEALTNGSIQRIQRWCMV